MSGWQAVDLWRDGVVHPLRPLAGLALVLHHFWFFLLGGRETVGVVGGGEPWGVATFASCRLCQGRFGRGHGWDGDYWPPQALPLLV